MPAKELVWRIVGAAFSGVLLSLCFPMWSMPWLMLPAITILLFAIRGTRGRAAFYLALLHGMIGYGLTMPWMVKIFSGIAFGLFFLIAVFTALFSLIFIRLERRTRSGMWLALGTATLWTGIEFYRSEWFPLRFPWVTPGSAWGVAAWLPVIGVYGGTFLTVLASALFLRRKTIIFGAILSVLLISQSFWKPAEVIVTDADAVVVGLVQLEGQPLETYIQQTQLLKKQNPDLVIWPECSLPYDIRNQKIQYKALTQLVTEMNCTFIVGTRTVVGSAPKAWRNTALVLEPDGVKGEYCKARPVHFFNDGMVGHDFNPVKTTQGAIGTPICFDCDYSQVLLRMAQNGVEYFAVPSCDPTYWTTLQHYQHAQFFQIRAAETGKWLACAATSGISQIIDPKGRVCATIAPMEEGVTSYRIGRRSRATFYTRIGWLFPWVASGVALLLSLFLYLPATVAKAFHFPVDPFGCNR